MKFYCIEEGTWGPSYANATDDGWRPVVFNEYGAVLVYNERVHAERKMEEIADARIKKRGHLPGPLLRIAEYARIEEHVQE